MSLDKIHQDLIEISERAAQIALSHFRPGEQTLAGIQYKGGSSPVTEADFAVDAFLKTELCKLLPEAGWLSEETEDTTERLAKRFLFVVDPIDGTRAFMSGDPRWAVSVALVEGAEVVSAALVAPALGETFAALRGQGATLNGIALTRQSSPPRQPIAAGPVPMLDMLQNAGIDLQRIPKIPSLAYRLVSVATNAIDIGLAGANSHDWDIAAADLILQETNVRLTNFTNELPAYNRQQTRHGALVAARDPLQKTACAVFAAPHIPH